MGTRTLRYIVYGTLLGLDTEHDSSCLNEGRPVPSNGCTIARGELLEVCFLFFGVVHAVCERARELSVTVIIWLARI